MIFKQNEERKVQIAYRAQDSGDTVVELLDEVKSRTRVF